MLQQQAGQFCAGNETNDTQDALPTNTPAPSTPHRDDKKTDEPLAPPADPPKAVPVVRVDSWTDAQPRSPQPCDTLSQTLLEVDPPAPAGASVEASQQVAKQPEPVNTPPRHQVPAPTPNEGGSDVGDSASMVESACGVPNPYWKFLGCILNSTMHMHSGFVATSSRRPVA